MILINTAIVNFINLRIKMLDSLIRMALRNGFSVKTVNPAYTSVIGKLKYSKSLVLVFTKPLRSQS